MTAIRTSQQNAYEGTLTAEMGPNDTTCIVDDIGILTSPCLLVIEMDSDSQREYIYFDGTFTATTFTAGLAVPPNRYLSGSAAGSNLTHPIGTKIRTYQGKQHHDDLHDRIDGLSHDDLDNLSADDHALYPLVDGSRGFSAAVGGADAVANTDLATKQQVDALVSGAQPVGLISMWAGAVGSPPTGNLICDGDEISRATYAVLFSVIGETFGVGNGTTTFDLPDLRNRLPMGADTTVARGAQAGVDEIDLQHSHTVDSHTHDIGHSHADTFTTASDGHTHTMPTHTHTMPSHTHSGPSHTHTMGTHTHSFSDTSGGPSGTAGRNINSPTGLVGSSIHTHFVSGTTGSKDPGDTNAGGTGNTGSTDPGDANAKDPGDTNSDSHSHTVNGSVTDKSGNSGSASPGMNNQLSTTESILNPVLGLHFIIKAS